MNTGPSDETLRNLNGMLPQMVSGDIEDSKHTNSRLCCICGKGHFHKQVIIDPRSKLETLADSHTCGACQGYLDAGDVAVVSADNRYAFVAPIDQLESHSGKRITVSTEVMDHINQQHNGTDDSV